MLIIYLFRSEKFSETVLMSKTDEIEFPCDLEDGAAETGNVLLDVGGLTHIYPDGTHAVKGLSFKVAQGEVLSFLGANGAGRHEELVTAIEQSSL